ncbi:unnamed protein product [Mytilus coruscus]|uniref:Endonuclease/exonuclease/phosphatase domain-containing protein n=1 Tax=Mytilus coruscus TaxID=42192 RepID=A0A6J8DQU2_MYTCO|nr:unnamed protein product [Mytilus coruscus]
MIAAKKPLQLGNITKSKDIELITGTINLEGKKKMLNETPEDIFLIGGDFNLPDINWSEQSILNRQYPIRTNQTFLEIVADNGLEQIVHFTTRKDNTLDLILTSHPAFKLRCKPLPSIGNSDHDIVLLDLACKPFKPKPLRRKIYLWKKAEIHKIKEAEILNDQFQSVFTKENLNNFPNKGKSPYSTMDDIKITRSNKEENSASPYAGHWPKGTYTLVKPKTGCPSRWKEGWRLQDNEDRRNSNSITPGHHFYGSFGRNMKFHYCTKDEHVISGHYNWPRGNYCILRQGISCPPGFRTGSILWDDEDNRNSNALGGVLPSGSYDRNTLINYCCRSDGLARKRIILPKINHSIYCDFDHHANR